MLVESGMSELETICRTPTPGKQSTRIPTWKFDALRDAILEQVPTTGDGLIASTLSALVRQHLAGDVLERLGSVSSHTISAKLELEVRGKLVRVPRRTPQRLLRTTAKGCAVVLARRATPDKASFPLLLPLVTAFHKIEKLKTTAADRRAAVSTLLKTPQLGKIWLLYFDDELAGYLAICYGYSVEFGAETPL
jgi:hypothetical protein